MVPSTILPPANGETSGAAPAPAPTPRRAQLLVVEDHPDVAEGMVTLLELLGHDVRLASDGEAALSLAHARPPEAMLIDIGLPGMDGYEVARRLRADPALTGVLLIALTGYGRLEDKQRAFAAGFDHHLTKPVELQQLNALLASLPAR